MTRPSACGAQQHRGSDGVHRRGASYSRRLERRAAKRAADAEKMQTLVVEAGPEEAPTEAVPNQAREVPVKGVEQAETTEQVESVASDDEVDVETALDDTVVAAGDDIEAAGAPEKTSDTTVSFDEALAMMRRSAPEIPVPTLENMSAAMRGDTRVPTDTIW